MKLLRRIKSVCPTCIKDISAHVVEYNGKVYMLKECDEHGKFKVLLSRDVSYYRKLHDLFNKFGFIGDESYKRNYYNLYLTLKCNLNCTICLTNANSESEEPSLELIKKIVGRMKKTKIGLWGGEPTLRNDLPEIIRIIRKLDNIPVLYTNGIKIADYNYLKTLKKSGLDVVHLQFDGFDDEIYKKLRGRGLIDIKLKSLDNLRRLKIPTVLETTFVKDLNENEMKSIVDFAAMNKFITAVLFRSYSHQGKKGLAQNKQLLGEELIDTLDKQTGGRITKKKVLKFQKWLYRIYNLTSTRRCFYNQYFVLKRTKKRWKTFDDPGFFTSGLINTSMKWFKLLFERRFLQKSFTSSSMPDDFFILGFGCICNAYDYEESSKKVCIGGEILPDGRIINSLVESNLLREKELFKISNRVL